MNMTVNCRSCDPTAAVPFCVSSGAHTCVSSAFAAADAVSACSMTERSGTTDPCPQGGTVCYSE